MIPHLNCTEGDVVFVRAVVVSAESDFFTLRIENYPKYVFTAFAPVSEIAKREDIDAMPPIRLPRVKVSPVSVD
jgi:hypothetical protein